MCSKLDNLCNLQLDSFIQTIRRTVWHVNSYVEHVKLQLNMLSLGHLSPSVIISRSLKGLLLEKENYLPQYLKLLYDTKEEIGSYIRVLLIPQFWKGGDFWSLFQFLYWTT